MGQRNKFIFIKKKYKNKKRMLMNKMINVKYIHCGLIIEEVKPHDVLNEIYFMCECVF